MPSTLGNSLVSFPSFLIHFVCRFSYKTLFSFFCLIYSMNSLHPRVPWALMYQTIQYQQKGFVGKSKSPLFRVVWLYWLPSVQMMPKDCSVPSFFLWKAWQYFCREISLLKCFVLHLRCPVSIYLVNLALSCGSPKIIEFLFKVLL